MKKIVCYDKKKQKKQNEQKEKLKKESLTPSA
jgi:hypothetical protein